MRALRTVRTVATLAGIATAMLLEAAGCGGDVPILQPPRTPSDEPPCPEDMIEDMDGDCVPEECGVGPWGLAEPLDDGAIVYVRASAAGGGDGSQDHPFYSIQDGLDAAGALGGGTVAVAAGTYVENLLLTVDHQAIHLAGRCADLAIVDGSGGDPDHGMTIDINGSSQLEITLSGVRVTGGGRCGIRQVSGTLHLLDVLLADNVGGGLEMEGNLGRAYLERVEIRDTAGATASAGFGIEASPGSIVVLTNSTIANNHGAGIYAAGARLELTEVVVSDTRRQSQHGYTGCGVLLERDSYLTARHSVFSGNATAGLWAEDESIAVLEEVEIRDTQTNAVIDGAAGIRVEEGARLLAHSGHILRNPNAGISIDGPDATAFLEGVTITGTSDYGGSPAGTGGVGIHVSGGAQLTAVDTVLEYNTRAGIEVLGEGTLASLAGVEVLATLPDSEDSAGWGIRVDDRAFLEDSSGLLTDNAAAGVSVEGSGEVLLVGTDIVGTRRGVGDQLGSGVVCLDGCRASLFAVSIVDTEGIGARTEGGDLTCEACELQGNVYAGALVRGGGMTLHMSAVEDTVRDPMCGGGVGVVGLGQGPLAQRTRLSVLSSNVEGNERAGLWLDGAGRYQINDNDVWASSSAPRAGETHGWGDGLYVTGGMPAANTNHPDTDIRLAEEGLFMSGNLFVGFPGAAIFLDGASVGIASTHFDGNSIDLVQQQCDLAPEILALSDWLPWNVEICPDEDYPVLPLGAETHGCP